MSDEIWPVAYLLAGIALLLVLRRKSLGVRMPISTCAFVVAYWPVAGAVVLAVVLVLTRSLPAAPVARVFAFAGMMCMFTAPFVVLAGHMLAFLWIVGAGWCLVGFAVESSHIAAEEGES